MVFLGLVSQGENKTGHLKVKFFSSVVYFHLILIGMIIPSLSYVALLAYSRAFSKIACVNFCIKIQSVSFESQCNKVNSK